MSIEGDGPEFVDYVFQLTTPAKDHEVEKAVEDVLTAALEQVSERISGREFDLKLEKHVMPTIPDVAESGQERSDA